MTLQLLPLGSGRGADSVVSGACSTAFTLVNDGVPRLQFDLGFGVVRQYRDSFGETMCPLYVSHNHSDHAAELPVLVAIGYSSLRPVALWAQSEVMQNLSQHRLHELRSTGVAIEELLKRSPIEANHLSSIDHEVSVRAFRASHAECCYGLLIYFQGTPVVAIGGDSAFDETYYEKLIEAPVVVLDARLAGNSQHASFDEVFRWKERRKPCVEVYLTGYGAEREAPLGLRLAVPGAAIRLGLQRNGGAI